MELYGAGSFGVGASLDTIDNPLNNIRYLAMVFDELALLPPQVPLSTLCLRPLVACPCWGGGERMVQCLVVVVVFLLWQSWSLIAMGKS